MHPLPMKRRAVVTLILLCAVSAAAQEFDARADRELVQLVNQERARAGLPALETDARLTEAARRHAVLLAEHRGLSHRFAGEAPLRNRIAATGLRFNRVGENVASDSEGAQAAHLGLMHSPPHRANILHPDYNRIGVGAIWKDGVLYVAQDFVHAFPDMTAEEIEAAIAGQLGRKGNAHDPRLRQAACERGRDPDLGPSALFKTFPQARRAMFFSLEETRQLPGGVDEYKNAPGTYVLGACFVKSKELPQGIFWVALVFE
jgi:hypothetical protein